MLLGITGALCVAMVYLMINTISQINQISNVYNDVKEKYDTIEDINRDVNMVEHTIMNRIDAVEQLHTRTEDEIRQVITGSMKSSNKRLLKG
jgi:ATP-dependent RNA circularization protein (DNA/RNA ligase family)